MTDNVIDLEDARADADIAMADVHLNALLEEIMADDKHDAVGVAFSIWIGLIHFLAATGFTAEELEREVRDHVKIQQKVNKETEE